jgi:hypothetical protein
MEKRANGQKRLPTLNNAFLLPDGGSHWNDIEWYLKGINANVVRFHSGFDPRALKKTPPDIFIVGEKASSDLLSYQLRNHVMIVVSHGGIPGTVTHSRKNPKLVTVNWPMAPDAFLKLAADLTWLSQRRVFRALLRIFPDGGEVSCLGHSMDFSPSGMGLRTEHKLTDGEKVVVSLSLPTSPKSLRIPLQIMRSTPDGDMTIYGGKFVDLGPEERKAIDAFIDQE